MFIRRSLFFVIGLFIISFGVGLTIKADLGAGAWDALNVGLSNTIGLTVGSWVIIVGVILIFVNAVLLKKKPEYLAVITIFLVGMFIDFWLLLIMKNLDPDQFIVKLVLFAVGLLFLAMGIAIYLQAKFPLIPIDNFMIAIRERLHVSLGMAKTIGELTALLLAFLFNGPIGLGTILVTFLIGPIIQFFFPYFERLMNRTNPSH
ncbi:DUF6198 family protein [Bacillus timonensis]|nr:DUF6198 family protein [Bacillus timonensis]